MTARDKKRLATLKAKKRKIERRAKARAKRSAPKVESYRAKRFGILNHLGGIWTPETFSTPTGAQAHLEKARATWAEDRELLRAHKVVPVRVTVSEIRPRAKKRR